jgi:hypothetical protein
VWGSNDDEGGVTPGYRSLGFCLFFVEPLSEFDRQPLVRLGQLGSFLPRRQGASPGQGTLRWSGGILCFAVACECAIRRWPKVWTRSGPAIGLKRGISVTGS